MTTTDVRNLVKYLFNVERVDFARDIYKKDDDDYYVQEKFKKMQTNPLWWIGTLDEPHLQRLVTATEEKYG